MDLRNMTLSGRGGRLGAAAVLLLALAVAGAGVPAQAASGSAFPITVNQGQSLVLETPSEVSTVSIADADVADAAVGSQRTVVVNGKKPGVTSLVVWEEGGKYTLYEVPELSFTPTMLRCSARRSSVSLARFTEVR
jgi:Flp pilus assembly secretin CpaC